MHNIVVEEKKEIESAEVITPFPLEQFFNAQEVLPFEILILLILKIETRRNPQM